MGANEAADASVREFSDAPPRSAPVRGPQHRGGADCRHERIERLGAALTYARRYALFTLVDIAGRMTSMRLT